MAVILVKTDEWQGTRARGRIRLPRRQPPMQSRAPSRLVPSIMTVTPPHQIDTDRQRVLSLDRLVVAEAFVVIAALALMMQAQADTWWHLAAGRDMAQSKHVALTDSKTVPNQ